jgi:hypothetical protein
MGKYVRRRSVAYRGGITGPALQARMTKGASLLEFSPKFRSSRVDPKVKDQLKLMLAAANCSFSEAWREYFLSTRIYIMLEAFKALDCGEITEDWCMQTFCNCYDFGRVEFWELAITIQHIFLEELHDDVMSVVNFPVSKRH